MTRKNFALFVVYKCCCDDGKYALSCAHVLIHTFVRAVMYIKKKGALSKAKKDEEITHKHAQTHTEHTEHTWNTRNTRNTRNTWNTCIYHTLAVKCVADDIAAATRSACTITRRVLRCLSNLNSTSDVILGLPKFSFGMLVINFL